MTEITEPKPQTQSHPTPKKSPRFSLLNLGILCSAFAFIALITVFYIGFYQLTESSRLFTGFMNDATHSLTDDQKNIQTLQENFNRLQSQLTDQQKTLSALHGSQQNNWTVAEAYHLVQLANDHLQLGDNVTSIITLLTTADQKLKDLPDEKIVSLRKALATDIAALQTIPPVDYSGIYLQLSSLNAQVDTLPLFTKRPTTPAEKNSSDETQSSWWKQGLQQSLTTLRQIVIIRYNQPGVRPFIPPEQQDFLYQNLHAELLQAMTAVVQKQPKIYQASLQQATHWIRQYFLPDSPVTQAMLKSLEQLYAINIQPELPALTTSLQAFRSYGEN